MKIAICDDSREDRGELRKLLEACGYDFEIKEYGSGEEQGGMPEGTYRAGDRLCELCAGRVQGKGEPFPLER